MQGCGWLWCGGVLRGFWAETQDGETVHGAADSAK